jgi:hypothetical protein
LTDLVRYHHQSPDTLDPTQVQNFLLYLTQERHLAWSSVSVAASAIRFFYTHTVKRLDLAMAMPPRRTPRRHVVPPHVPRIRHVGVLANGTKKARLAQCRRLLNAAPPPAPATRTTVEQLHALTGVDRSRCPHCDTGTMALVSRVPTVRDRPGVGATPAFEDSS